MPIPILVDRLVPYISSDPWCVGFDSSLLRKIPHLVDTPWYREVSVIPCGEADQGTCSDPYYHAARIYYLATSGGRLLDTPIEIDNHCFGGRIYPEPVIMDGNHRFFARVLRKDPIILAEYGGRIDLRNYLTGKRKKAPD